MSLVVESRVNEAEQQRRQFGQWMIRNSDFLYTRSAHGVVSKYLGSIGTEVTKRIALERLPTLVSDVHSHRKLQHPAESSDSGGQLQKLAPNQQVLFSYLNANHGKLISYESANSTYFRKADTPAQREVLDQSMKSLRQWLLDEKIGILSSVDGRGYFFISAAKAKLSFEVLNNIYTDGHGRASVALMGRLLLDHPNVVPYCEIFKSMGLGTDTAPNSLSQPVSRLNQISEGQFLIQAARGEGYRIIRGEALAPHTMSILSSSACWAREGDLLIHFLDSNSGLVSKEETMAFFPEGPRTQESSWRKYMRDFTVKVREFGVDIEPVHNESNGYPRPICGFRIKGGEASNLPQVSSDPGIIEEQSASPVALQPEALATSVEETAINQVETCSSILVDQELEDETFEDIEPAPIDPSNFDFCATDAAPGSMEKLDMLRKRCASGYPLWHPDDRTFSDLSFRWRQSAESE